MIRFRNSINFNLPVETVFDFVVESENLPRWNYYVKKVTKQTPGDVKIGARYHQVRHHDEQTFEVTRFEIYKVFELTTIPESRIFAKRTMNFTFSENETQLKDFFELDTGHPSFLQRFFVKKIRQAVRQNLDKLKQILETGQTTLQDGSVSSL